MEKRHRVFIAINLPENIKKILARYQEKYSELPARWIKKDNLHITLEFLGYLTDVDIVDVCKSIADVAKKHNSFSINLNRVLYGPPHPHTISFSKNFGVGARKMPKMIWAMGKGSKELVDLKQDLQEFLLEAVRFRPNINEFSPHITLARIKEWEFKKIELEERSEINEDINLIFTVESIEVMESQLKRGGPVYSILESYELKT